MKLQPVVVYLVEITDALYARREFGHISYKGGVQAWSDPAVQFSCYADAKVCADDLGGKVLNLRITPEVIEGTKVNDLEMSTRAANCLNNAGIITLGDLTQRTSADLLRIHQFGKRSLREIKNILANIGLSLKDSQ